MVIKNLKKCYFGDHAIKSTTFYNPGSRLSKSSLLMTAAAGRPRVQYTNIFLLYYCTFSMYFKVCVFQSVFQVSFLLKALNKFQKQNLKMSSTNTLTSSTGSQGNLSAEALAPGFQERYDSLEIFRYDLERYCFENKKNVIEDRKGRGTRSHRYICQHCDNWRLT